MTKKRELMFSIVRGLLAILIALLVATLLIFISANGDNFSEKLASTGDALKQMLVGPLFRTVSYTHLASTAAFVSAEASLS